MGGIELEGCYYCGIPADTVDHVTPRSVMAMLPDPESNPVSARTVTVPCCRECNNGLGNRVYDTLADRKRAAKARLRRRYRRVLTMPDWSEAELSELDPDLQGFVRHNLVLRDLTHARLAW